MGSGLASMALFQNSSLVRGLELQQAWSAELGKVIIHEFGNEAILGRLHALFGGEYAQLSSVDDWAQHFFRELTSRIDLCSIATEEQMAEVLQQTHSFLRVVGGESLSFFRKLVK